MDGTSFGSSSSERGLKCGSDGGSVMVNCLPVGGPIICESGWVEEVAVATVIG